MRIVIDASNIITGGGLTHLKEFISHANPKAHGFDSVVLWSSTKTLNRIDDKEWLAKRSNLSLNKGYIHRFIWKHFVLKPTLNEGDVLFIPGTGYLDAKAKVVTMCRNLLPLEESEMNRFYPGLTWVRLKLLSYLHLKSFNSSDGVIFLNEYCLERATKLSANLKDYCVIPHGVNEKFKHQRTDYSLNGKLELLYVSTIDLYKHQWQIAKAVLELNVEGFNISLTLIGEAYSSTEILIEDVLKKYPEHSSSVKWLGKVSYEELGSYYKNADAFIYGSTCETFGMTLLEAMASSLPIACSNKSSMNNLLNEGGIYFEPENIKSIKNAILKLLKSKKLRKEYGTKAFKLASKYSWEKTAHNTLKYLSEIGES